MSSRAKPSRPTARDSLTVEVGGWFKANATGAGVFVIGVILVILALLGLLQFWLSLPA